MAGDDLKRAAAERAVGLVASGMRLGLGTGSTAAHFVRLLGEQVRGRGLEIVGVPTSEATRRLAEECGIPLTTLDETPELDLTVDGADEIDPRLRLVKGGGAALLREKIVAAASRRMVVIADEGKRVEVLGAFPLPVEVVPFGHRATKLAIERVASRMGLSGPVTMRERDGGPVLTDNGNYVYDAAFGKIPDVESLSDALHDIPGVVEHGLFVGLCSAAVVAGPDGVEILGEA